MKTFKEYLDESCWKGYTAIGVKKKETELFLIVFQ